MRCSVHVPAVVLLLVLTAGLSYCAGRQSAPVLTVRLDNERVTVTASETPAGGRRQPYTRPTDQLIIFLDEAHYEAVDSLGTVAVRHRRVGDVVWHTAGERAPLLVNQGDAYRNLIIALK